MAASLPKTKRVLVIDDDVLTLELTADQVKGLGYEAVTASSASQALAVDIASIDAVLCDLVMPVQSGDAFLGALRDWRKAGVPFLFMTTDADDAPLSHHVAHLGAVTMVKPLDVDALGAMLRQMLSRERK